jgi:hypothetical protein
VVRWFGFNSPNPSSRRAASRTPAHIHAEGRSAGTCGSVRGVAGAGWNRCDPFSVERADETFLAAGRRRPAVFSASGCFSGSAGESGPRPPASEAHPVGGAALDITVREGVGGAPAHLWRFHVSCPRTKGDVAPTPVCEQITAPGARFFGVPASSTTLWGGTGSLRIRGTVNGLFVSRSYSLGETPQYANWIRLLFGRPLDPAVRYAGGEVTNVPVQPTGVTNQRANLPCPAGAICVVRLTQRLVGGPRS